MLSILTWNAGAAFRGTGGENMVTSDSSSSATRVASEDLEVTLVWNEVGLDVCLLRVEVGVITELRSSDRCLKSPN